MLFADSGIEDEVTDAAVEVIDSGLRAGGGLVSFGEKVSAAGNGMHSRVAEGAVPGFCRGQVQILL